MAIRIPSTRASWLRLGLGLMAVIVAVLVGLAGLPASADRADLTLNWDGRHHQAWNGGAPSSPYYAPRDYPRQPQVACGTNTVMGMLLGAVLGGAIGQSADRANGC